MRWPPRRRISRTLTAAGARPARADRRAPPMRWRRLDVAAALAERAARGRLGAADISSTMPVSRSTGGAPSGGGGGAVAAARRDASSPMTAGLSEDGRLWLVTGPNMGGKSTFLRQNALIAVLAQAGSFVPADMRPWGWSTSLFSRVGASDNLARGRSTFMVEMVETAAHPRAGDAQRSFVILDEVGRGTSTYDGLAIAWAVVEAIHERQSLPLPVRDPLSRADPAGRAAATRCRSTMSGRANGRASWSCSTKWPRARPTAATALRWRGCAGLPPVTT